MAKNPLSFRTKQYFELSSQIAQWDNAKLMSLLSKSQTHESSTGWGVSHTIGLGQSKVFVKRIPVTTLEYNNLFSTKNLYDLPTYCNYGFGSTGFGVFRELTTHIKTTHWVLAGEISTFPLMYHYRIIPFSGRRTNVDMEQHNRYVESWGNNANVGTYALERAIANHELVLFLEHIPYVLEHWLQKNHHKLETALDDLRKTIGFLRKKGIIHFDAHFQNVLTDSEQIYLTDFGLALDKSFALTQDEETFFKQNEFYDYGDVLRNVGHLIRPIYDACSETNKRQIAERYGLTEGLLPYQLRTILLNNIEQIHADGLIPLDAFYVASIVKYRSVIMLMQDFFAEMWSNNKKDTKLPHQNLQQLLEEAGFLSNP